MTQAGPKYDNAMKAMCAEVPGALCRWLGLADDGAPDRAVRVVRLSEMAPKTATHQVDALLAVGEHLVVHVEFQTAGQAFFGWRMLDYRSLLVRRPEIAGKVLSQHVVVLGRDTIESGVHDNQVDYDFAVHNVREEHVDSFLTDPALAPFAVLADVPDDQREHVLRQAIRLITKVSDVHLRKVLTQAAVDLARIRLDPITIRATLEETVMPVPSAMPEIGELYAQDERHAFLASLLEYHFGPDGRISDIARGLVTGDRAGTIRRIEEAKSLDELALEG